MKPTLFIPKCSRFRRSPQQRQHFLAQFDASGLSAAAFARKHQIAYATFSAWLRRRAQAKAFAFTEVEVVAPHRPEPLVLELGPYARVRLTSQAQLALAAGLLQHLQVPC